MVRQVNVTGAESCWDDGFADDEDCESYLRNQKSRMMAEEADADVDEDDDAEDEEDDTDDADDESSDDVTAEAEESSTEEDEEEESADESEATAEEETEITSEADPEEEGKKMIKGTKASGKVTKADAIRAVIEAKQAAGVEFRPRDVIEALKKKGIEVNASQVSITLRAMGVPAVKRGLAAKKATKPDTDGETTRSRATAKVRAIEPRTAADGDGVSSNMVEQAADFMHAAGGYDEAVSLLNLCKKVMQRS